EAVQLDPTNQQTHKNLKDIRKVMAQIEGGAVFESERSSRTTSPSSGKTTFKFWSSLGKNVGKVFNGPLFFLLFIPFTIDGIKGSPWWLGPSLGLVWVVLSVWCVISWIKDDYQNS
ncbi:MAG: hypothetical protein SGJ20_22305, partial [Planctomycetota bacterium]|nr:hypothetical protein [Planctomycetota bacterium]